MADTRLASNAGLYPSSRLVGTLVENPAGQVLGVLEEFIIDLGEGCVAAAVIGLKDRDGADEKLVAVPIAALGYDAVECKCLLNWSRETLQDAPAFQATAVRGAIDRSWIADLYTYFGGVPYWF
jgi:hypothetical protein